VPGVGPLTATALVAAVGNARRFRNGRELSAYLGLVPRQHSSGGKTVLLGITKRGDRYLRTPRAQFCAPALHPRLSERGAQNCVCARTDVGT
jgi:transposase